MRRTCLDETVLNVFKVLVDKDGLEERGFILDSLSACLFNSM